jgi:hypothetical protein
MSEQNPLLAALAAANAQTLATPAQDSVPEIVWRLLSTVRGTAGTPGTVGHTLSEYVTGRAATEATVGMYFLYNTSPDFGSPTRRVWSWNEWTMDHTHIFELIHTGTFENPRIGARWVTGLVPGQSPNTENETVTDRAGASLDIDLAPPVHYYTFPHTDLTHSLTKILVMNKVARKDAVS